MFGGSCISISLGSLRISYDIGNDPSMSVISSVLTLDAPDAQGSYGLLRLSQFRGDECGSSRPRAAVPMNYFG
jgi:hypothetical protein